MLQSKALRDILTQDGYLRKDIATSSEQEQPAAIATFEKAVQIVRPCFANKAGAMASIASTSLPCFVLKEKE